MVRIVKGFEKGCIGKVKRYDEISKNYMIECDDYDWVWVDIDQMEPVSKQISGKNLICYPKEDK